VQLYKSQRHEHVFLGATRFFRVRFDLQSQGATVDRSWRPQLKRTVTYNIHVAPVQRLMKLLRVRGMPADFEVGITLGMCYLTYYVTNSVLHLSGVIAVVVYGLYGSATLKWEMSAVGAQEHFPRFWDVLSQVLPAFTPAHRSCCLELDVGMGASLELLAADPMQPPRNATATATSIELVGCT
jgi:hypothetical protein